MTSTTAPATISIDDARRALLRLEEAVNEFRAVYLAESLAASGLPSIVRLVWLRDLYTTDDEPRAWIVQDDEVNDIDDAEHVGVEVSRHTVFGATLLMLLADGDEPVRHLAVGSIEEVDNPDGASGYVAHISTGFAPSESAQRLVAANLPQK
ncbi:hypothetical protein [Gordonia aichiensis]|uniref:hypothetical protein n=1 Tax=Gordonia aichiensis TaxID=36820 RepID=UPI0032673206